jgi:hypothetical protein
MFVAMLRFCDGAITAGKRSTVNLVPERSDGPEMAGSSLLELSGKAVSCGWSCSREVGIFRGRDGTLIGAALYQPLMLARAVASLMIGIGNALLLVSAPALALQLKRRTEQAKPRALMLEPACQDLFTRPACLGRQARRALRMAPSASSAVPRSTRPPGAGTCEGFTSISAVTEPKLSEELLSQ